LQEYTSYEELKSDLGKVIGIFKNDGKPISEDDVVEIYYAPNEESMW
jgi:hypothetical protein